jgi:hypothetical protein
MAFLAVLDRSPKGRKGTTTVAPLCEDQKLRKIRVAMLTLLSAPV